MGGKCGRLILCAALAAAVLSAQPVDVYSRPKQRPRSHDYDVIHYRIELRLHEPDRSMQGKATITLDPLRDGFNSIALDAETFTVQAVEDTAGGALRFEQTPGRLLVKLERAHSYRERLSVKVFYTAANVAVDPAKFGMKMGYDLGLGFKARTADNPSLINTLSFPEGARHWFPCFDHPSDKATSEIIATVREDYQVISNGKLLRVTADSVKREKTFQWLQERPHSTYLFVLVAGPYVEIKDPGSPPISYWVYPKDTADAPRSFHRTREILDFFSREFDFPYPWVKYDQITIPRFGGGAESTTATVVGDGTIHDEMADKDFPSHWLVAHEAAHQWWGNLVTMRDWDQTWINEGFATYYEHLYYRQIYGEDEGALDLHNKKKAYLNEAHSRYQRPIVFDRWEVPNDNFDRHAYAKAGVVISMLRWILGNGNYRRAITHFLHKHSYQSADTHDLLVAIREATGQSMDWFVDQWILHPGHPVFEVRSEWDSVARQLILHVDQKQEPFGRVPVFQTPVDIGITTAAGKSINRAWLRKRNEVLRFHCPQKPLLVHFDEGDHLLCELQFPKSPSELIYQLEHDSAMGRLKAASDLKGYASHPDVREALIRTISDDAFWAVRREALLATEPIPSVAMHDVWKRAALDPKSRVRAEALRLLGTLQNRSLSAFLADRYQREDSYIAQAEALRSMGRCRDRALEPLLQTAATRKSPGNILSQAAREALQQLRPEKDSLPWVRPATFAALMLFALSFLGIWIGSLWRMRRDLSHPTLLELGTGMATNFFDTLGIGSFATTTSIFKFARMVPDNLIPGTLNAGHTLPTIFQAFLYIAVVEVQPGTLLPMIGGAVAGAWFGAGWVARLGKRNVQIGVAITLLVAFIVMLARQMNWFPAGGDALGLQGGSLALAVLANALLGAVSTLGIGFYAPCMTLVSMLGMNPIAAFPIMMGSSAFLMPVASTRFVWREVYVPRVAMGLAIGGLVGVPIAAFLVKSLPIHELRWLVMAVILWAAVAMLRSALDEIKHDKHL